MAQAIIARMGGRITCVSIEGTGTKFKVLVPFTVAERSQKPISFSMPLPTAARISVSVSRPVLSVRNLSAITIANSSLMSHVLRCIPSLPGLPGLCAPVFPCTCDPPHAFAPFQIV